MKDSAEPAPSGTTSLAAALLDYYGAPGKYQLTLRQPAVLFASVREILQLASGRGPADAPQSPRVREAANFFIRAALVYPGADHYAVLGFTPADAATDAKERYRLLMRLIHPDFAAGATIDWPDDAAVRVNRAYEVLSSPVLRREYDEQLASARARRPAPPAPSAVRQRAVVPRAVSPHRTALARKVAWSLALAALVPAAWLLMPGGEPVHLVQRPAPPKPVAAGKAPSASVLAEAAKPADAQGDRPPAGPASAVVAEAQSAGTREIAPGDAGPVPASAPVSAGSLGSPEPPVSRPPPPARQPSAQPVLAQAAPARAPEAPPPTIAAQRPLPAPVLPKPQLAPPAPEPAPVAVATAAADTPRADTVPEVRSPMSFAPLPPAIPPPAIPPPAIPPVASAAPLASPVATIVVATVPTPTLNDAQPLLTQVLQMLESGSGDQILRLLDRDARSQAGAQALSRQYEQLVKGARPVRLSEVEFRAEPGTPGILLVTGRIRLHAGEPTIGSFGHKLIFKAEFAQRAGKTQLTGLSGASD